MGHSINPNVIRGPSQRFSRTRRVHWRWNTWVQSSWEQSKEINIKWFKIWSETLSVLCLWKTLLFLELVYLYGRGSRESLCEADHTHVICILFQTAGVLVTAVQTWKAALLILDSSTGVSARMSFTAGQFSIFLTDTTWGTLMRLLNHSVIHTYYTTLHWLVCILCEYLFLSAVGGQHLIHHLWLSTDYSFWGNQGSFSKKHKNP